MWRQLILLSVCALSACTKTGTVEIKVINPQPARVNWEAELVDDTGQVRSRGSVTLDPGGATTQPEGTVSLHDAEAGWKVRTSYKPVVGVSRFVGEERAVAKVFPDRWTATVGTWNAYDPQSSVNALTALASVAMPADSPVKDYGRIVEVAKYLGGLILTSDKSSAQKIIASQVGFISIENVPLDLSGAKSTESKTKIAETALANVTINIPLYADLKSHLQSGKLYELTWSIKHFRYASTFDPTIAMQALPQPELAVIAAHLALHASPAVSVCSPHSMWLITEGHYSVTEGRKRVANAELASSAVFTAGGEYAFSDEKQTIIEIPGVVVDLEFRCLPSVEFKEWVKTLGQGSKAAPTFHPVVVQ